MKLRQWLNALRILLFGDIKGRFEGSQKSIKTIGKQGEIIALHYLQRLGWRLIDMNIRIGRDELDILVVSPDERTLAIVEVRTTADYSKIPERTITARKRARMLRMAKKLQSFAKKHRCILRVDVIAVTLSFPDPCIRHYEGVFPIPRPRFVA